jgi:uncharacterized membrane protein YadS
MEITLVPSLILFFFFNPILTAAKYPQKSHLTVNFITTFIFSIAMPALATQMDSLYFDALAGRDLKLARPMT